MAADMGADKTLELISASAAGTEKIGAAVGARLKGGEVIELVSDLGGGKTTFVRGLARGLGSADHVSSPTFKISNVYKAGSLELHHFDFYRLSEAGIVTDELAEIIGRSDAAIVVEWGDVVRETLPGRRLSVNLYPTGETARRLVFRFQQPLNYLLEGVKS